MKYPLELKTKVLKDYFDGVDGIRGLERTYGIQHQLILSWIKNCGNPQKSLRQSEEQNSVSDKPGGRFRVTISDGSQGL